MGLDVEMSSKTVPFSARLPEELVESLEKEAEEVSPEGYKIPVSQVLAKILRDYFAAKSKKKKS